MSSKSFKDYQVNYQLNVQIPSTGGLTAMEGIIKNLNTAAKQAQVPLKNIAGHLNYMHNSIKNIKEKGGLTFTPTIDLTGFKTQIDSAVRMAAEGGRAAAEAFNAAMTGTKGKGKAPVSTKSLESLKAQHAEMLKELYKKDLFFNTDKKTGERILKGHLKKDIKKAYNDELAKIESIAKQIQQLEDARKKTGKRLSAINTSQQSGIVVSPAATGGFNQAWVAKQLKNGNKTVTLTIRAIDQTKTVLNAVASGLQSLASKGVIDIYPVVNAGALAQAESKLGLVNQRLQGLAGGRSINLGTKAVSDGHAGFAINRQISRLQELAGGRSIKLSTQFVSTGQAAFQLNAHITKLQELALSRPIKLTTVLAPNATGTKAITEKVAALKELQTVWSALPKTGSRTYTVNLKMPGIENLPKLKELMGMVGAMPPSQRRSYSASANTGTRSASNAAVRTVADKGAASTRYMGRPKGTMNTFAYQLMGNTSLGARTPVFLDMMKGMGMMSGVGAAMGTMTNAFTQASEYQNTMVTARAILENNYQGSNFASDFANMENIVRNVAKKTKFTAPQAADAARFMAMAGLNIPMINASIEPIADVAVIGDNDLGEVADKITNIQTAFGIKPNKMRALADALTKTFTSSNTDMMMLAESMEYAAPMAHLAGAQVEDALAMIGIMGNAGIQGSMAGTTLRMMYQNIINPNKKQQKMWESLGVKLKDENGNPRQLIDILGDLRQKVRISKDDKDVEGKFKDEGTPIAEAVSKLFRVTASAGAGTLLENLDKVIALAEANRNAGGLSRQISSVKQSDIKGMWAKMTSAFTDAVVTEFEGNQSPIKGYIENLTKYFNSPDFKDMLHDIFDLVTSMMDMLGKFAKMWKEIYNLFGPIIKYTLMAQFILAQIGYMIAPLRSVWLTVSRGLGVLGGLGGGIHAANAASTMAGGGVTAAGVVNAAASGGLLYIGHASNPLSSRRYKELRNLNSALALSNIYEGRVSRGGEMILASSVLGQTYLSRAGVMGNMPTVYNAMAQGGRSRMRLGANANAASAVLLGGAPRARYGVEYAARAAKYTRLANSGKLTNDLALRASGNALVYDSAADYSRKVRERAKSIYGFRNTTGRAFNQGFMKTLNWGITGVSMASIVSGFKVTVGAVGKALGALLNPITLAVAGVATMAGTLYYYHNKSQKLIKVIDESGKNFQNELKHVLNGKTFFEDVFSGIHTVNINTQNVNMNDESEYAKPLAKTDDKSLLEVITALSGKVYSYTDGAAGVGGTSVGTRQNIAISGISNSAWMEMYDKYIEGDANLKKYLPGLPSRKDFGLFVQNYEGITDDRKAAAAIVTAMIGGSGITSTGYENILKEAQELTSWINGLPEDKLKQHWEEYLTKLNELLKRVDPTERDGLLPITIKNYQKVLKNVPTKYIPYYESQHNAFAEYLETNPAIQATKARYNLLSGLTPRSDEWWKNVMAFAGNIGLKDAEYSDMGRFNLPILNGKLNRSELDKLVDEAGYEIENADDIYRGWAKMLFDSLYNTEGIDKIINGFKDISRDEFIGRLFDKQQQSIFNPFSFGLGNTSQQDYRSSYAPQYNQARPVFYHIENLVKVDTIKGGDGVTKEEMKEFVEDAAISAQKWLIEGDPMPRMW